MPATILNIRMKALVPKLLGIRHEPWKHQDCVFSSELIRIKPLSLKYWDKGIDVVKSIITCSVLERRWITSCIPKIAQRLCSTSVCCLLQFPCFTAVLYVLQCCLCLFSPSHSVTHTLASHCLVSAPSSSSVAVFYRRLVSAAVLTASLPSGPSVYLSPD